MGFMRRNATHCRFFGLVSQCSLEDRVDFILGRATFLWQRRRNYW